MEEQLHCVSLSVQEEELCKKQVHKLTDAAGALNGLFEAQKRLAGKSPSFANSNIEQF